MNTVNASRIAILTVMSAAGIRVRRAEFVHGSEQLRTELAAHGGSMLRTITSGGEGRSVTVDAAIDIRSVWSYLSRFENSGRRPRKHKKKSTSVDERSTK